MPVFGPEFDHFIFRLHNEADIARMLGEHARGGFPGMASGKFDAGLPRNAKRFHAGRFEIVAQHADRRGSDHVAGTGDRKRSYG